MGNFFLSASFIVSVKVGIFLLNMCDIITYVSRWSKKYLSKRNLFHDVINLLYYEHWTDKQKYFYVYKIVLLFLLKYFMLGTKSLFNALSLELYIPFDFQMIIYWVFVFYIKLWLINKHIWNPSLLVNIIYLVKNYNLSMIIV